MKKQLKENRGVKKGVKRGSYKKKPTEQPAEQTTEQPVEQPTEQPVEQPTEQPVERDFNINDQFNTFINENKTSEEFKESESIININNESEANFNTGNENFKSEFKNLVSGYMLLSLMDFVMPFAVIKIYSFVNKDFKKLNIKPNSLKLDSEQKEALKNSADEVAKYLFQKINPLTAFFIGASLFYGQNLFEQIELKKENLKQ